MKSRRHTTQRDRASTHSSPHFAAPPHLFTIKVSPIHRWGGLLANSKLGIAVLPYQHVLQHVVILHKHVMVLHKHVVLLRKHVVLLHKHVVVLCNSMKHRLDKQLELPHRPVVFMGTCGNHQSLLHKVATHTHTYLHMMSALKELHA